MSADEQDELLQDDDEIMSACEDEYEQPDGSQELQQELEQELDDLEDDDQNQQQIQQQEEEEGGEEGLKDGEIEQDEVKEEKDAKKRANFEMETGANMPAYLYHL